MAYRLDVKNTNKGTYLKIEKKYWSKEKKQARTKHIKSLGYLHDLVNEYPDPIAHFREVVEQMNTDEKETKIVIIAVDMTEKLEKSTDTRYNLGYAVIMNIYHKLELDRFFYNKARHQAFEYNTNNIMQLLIISRILLPSSIKKAFENKGLFFERFNFELYDIYRALTHYSNIGQDCQQFISDQIEKKYGRDTRLMYFDVTNFHFEIDKPDDLRKRGKSKTGRNDPLVQLALAMDADGIPLYYKIFPGNTHDSKTFIPVFREVCLKFNPGRVIAVADMGCAASNNIYYLKGGDRDKRLNGYVFSFSIRRSSKKFKEYVLDQTDYKGINGEIPTKDCDFKVKSRVDVRSISVDVNANTQKSYWIDEKQVVYWSAKYAKKAKAEREEIIKKALDVIKNPKSYQKDTVRGAKTYIKNIKFDKKTGEIIENEGHVLTLDEEKIKEDAKYDGYYCLITSELDMPTSRVIEIYRGLSEIEDNFKVSKSDLDLQPVFVSRKESIDAHALTCFISLVILRLIQRETKNMFTPEQIITCLNKISCSHEHENIYLFNYNFPIADEIGQAFNIDFSEKRLTLKEIKNILASSKK